MRKPTPLTPPSSRVYGYARVSTVDQSLEMQIAALVKAGVAREHIYSETISGAKRRPRLEALLKGLDPAEKRADAQSIGRILMRIEAQYVTGSVVAERWGYEPNLRAEIKQKLAEQLTMRMRTNDLIDFVVTTAENGDTVITASIEAASTGDERRAAASK